MLAFGMLLEQMGKRADWSPPTAFRRSIATSPARSRSAPHCASMGPYDAVILLECDGLERTRLRGLEQFSLINIDHHVSGRA